MPLPECHAPLSPDNVACLVLSRGSPNLMTRILVLYPYHRVVPLMEHVKNDDATRERGWHCSVPRGRLVSGRQSSCVEVTSYGIVRTVRVR